MKKLMMAAAVLCAMESIAQKKDVKQDNEQAGAKADTAKVAVKSYEKVITAKAITCKGLFTIHKIDENYYWEIPDSLLGRELLLISRISKSAVDGMIYPKNNYYAGDQIGERVINFEKGPGDKIFMRSISYWVNAQDSSENGMYRSVLTSSVQPILAAFPVKAFNQKAAATVIDVTDIISTDNSIMGFPVDFKSHFKIGGLQRDRSFIKSVKTFSQNIEVKTVKTFSSTVDATGSAFTFELNNSLVLLPKVPMHPRLNDQRVGYFGTLQYDFDADPQRVKGRFMITRWRLEPKPEDMEKYKRGELVEPQKPIVIYIDPATPKKWVPYLMQGVNDWQAAFERAGFKKAIYALEAPLNDSTWSLEDATHSAIVYKPSMIPNAMGPHVHDPRSGEILETHIHWFHNVMNLLHDWYMIQAAPLDPRARKMEFNDTLMGQLIRFVSSHEVGHTLGLMHNFGSSSTVPVDSLRNKRWVEAHGHTPSIMDYARFNYVAQPEDSISGNGIFPRIGEYDKWAIEWGYRLFPEIKDANDEKTVLNKLIIDSLKKNPRLWYGPQMQGGLIMDPRNQNEDLGDNSMKAATWGLKNLKRIITQLPEWTKTPNEGYRNLQLMFFALHDQYARYALHVIANIGGLYLTPKTLEQDGKQFLPVPKEKQQEAMAYLNAQVFQTPRWLFNEEIIEKGGPMMGRINFYGTGLLKGAMMRMVMLAETNRMFATAGNYTLAEFLSDLKKSIWTELAAGKNIDNYRRDLQNVYINALGSFVESTNKPEQATADLAVLLRLHLKALQTEIKSSLARFTDETSKAHLQYAAERIKESLDPNNKPAQSAPRAEPSKDGFQIINKPLFESEFEY